jgi:transposase
LILVQACKHIINQYKKSITYNNIHVCDVKKEANDSQITYGIKQYAARGTIVKKSKATTPANIVNNIRVIVANNLFGKYIKYGHHDITNIS